MKGRILRRRTRARASGAGYTLIELMVVVMLIAILAMLAAPSMVRARSDRLAFSYARQVGELVHNARARSAGRGAAHLVVFMQEFGGGNRGLVATFEALDGTPSTAKPPGPIPSSSCRGPGQWDFVSTWTPGLTDGANRTAIVDALNINATSTADVVVQENIRMLARFSPSDGSADPTEIKAFVLCTTPNGTTYFGRSMSSVTEAITAMQSAPTPFTDIVEIDVARHDPSNDTLTGVVGLNRRVLMTGAGSPRIKSE